MNSIIKTLPQLQDAIANTYIYSVIIGIVFVLILVIIANMIPWQSGPRDNSGSTRRSVFWILVVIAIISPLALNFFMHYQNISVPQFKSNYMMHMGLGALAAGTIYFVISFIIIRMQNKSTKLASIFPKKD